MGAATGCCTSSGQKSDSNLQKEAQINIQRVAPTASADHTEYAPRHSHQHRESISDFTVPESSSMGLRASRGSFDDQDCCAERNASSDRSGSSSTVSIDTDDAYRHRHRPSTASSHKKSHKSNRKKSSKSRNKLISSLKEVIRDFNGSMQSISALQMFGAQGQQHAAPATHTHFDQMEMLDEEHICKYFKGKHYNVDWFLITRREKFICVMANKWPNYSILTVAKIYEMLQAQISDLTPSISPSSTDLLTKSKKLSALNPMMMQPSQGNNPINISFVWKTTVSEVVDCDMNHFLYLASLVIKNLNQDILKENSLAVQRIQSRKPMLDQLEILTYFMDIQMNGYLFRHLHKHVFRRNVSRVLFDADYNSASQSEQLVQEYANRFHEAIDRFDVSTIYKDELCEIQFSSRNSKRWESVSSLIKGMKLSEYNVDVGANDDDSEGVDDDEHGSPASGHRRHETEDEKQKEPEIQQTIQAMSELRSLKQTMPKDDYIRKMETLQQKLEHSLRQS